MEKRYRRAQFLRDAVSLGLPAHLAFSRMALRRQRDRLILQHHPDCGGSEDKAWEINEIYGRMVKWRDEHYRPCELLDEPEAEENRAKRQHSLRQAAAVAVSAAILVASGYVVARGTKR
jgi:hypothetical protein